MQELDPDSEHFAWAGAVSIERGNGWVRPWRIPHEKRQLFYPDVLQQKAAMPSGVRIAFRSDTAEISGKIVPQPDMSPVDLCVNGEFVASSGVLNEKEEFNFTGLEPEDKKIELWLPMFGDFRIKSLSLAEGAFITAAHDDRPHWIAYGSSITQCRQAESPTQTWPAIVAMERGLNLTCLGFGGQCHLDPMIAHMIRDMPADVISFCIGANIYGSSSLNPRTLRPAVIGSVRTIREGHPRVPLVLVSCIYLHGVEGQKNAVGFTLQEMREEVQAAVEVLRELGDENVFYVDGQKMFGPGNAGEQPDGVHPNAEGYKVLGKNYLDVVAREYFPE